MVFYTSELHFGDVNKANARHFSDVNSMNSTIINNWNSIITPEDTVYVLGGVGDFDFLSALNGVINIMMSDMDRKFYMNYIKSVTEDIDDIYNEEMFEVYVKNMFYVNKVTYKRNQIIKDYTGKLLRLSTDVYGIKENDRKLFTISGSMGEYQRAFRYGMNTNIYVSGMFPVSEVEVDDFRRNVKYII